MIVYTGNALKSQLRVPKVLETPTHTLHAFLTPKDYQYKTHTLHTLSPPKVIVLARNTYSIFSPPNIIYIHFQPHTLTQFGSLSLPLQFKLLQHLLLLLGLRLEPQVRTNVYSFVMGGLKGSRRLVTTVHHLGDVVANTLGSRIELRVTVHTVEVVGLLNELFIAVCVGVCDVCVV